MNLILKRWALTVAHTSLAKGTGGLKRVRTYTLVRYPDEQIFAIPMRRPVVVSLGLETYHNNLLKQTVALDRNAPLLIQDRSRQRRGGAV